MFFPAIRRSFPWSPPASPEHPAGSTRSVGPTFPVGLVRMLGLIAAVCLLGGGVAISQQAEPARQVEETKNRLADESSPYLLQHARNPVDWYPWGDEAFERARREDKLVFLSVGYAACHWCHVMERESFEDDEIAAEMNRRFICVKVDREERPDVDQIYMTAVQLLSGHGGWPMSVFLTPDARPFWGGTYFPPRDGDRGNATGFLTILRKVDDFWQNRRDLVDRQADAVTEAIAENQSAASAVGPATDADLADWAPATAGRVAKNLAEQFDPEYGGFGYSEAAAERPKFPEPSNLVFLLWQATRETLADEQRAEAKRMLTHTLDGMLSGAMWDHVGGGFHRYAVDRRWQIPHFEKMLYDNAQLAPIYASAYALTGKEEYRDVATRTCEFVIREMRHEGGAFYSSIDADSEGEEGKFYRWSREELRRLEQEFEGSLWDLATETFRLSGDPNFESEFFVPAPGASLTDRAEAQNMTYPELDRKLREVREKLLALRDRRDRPPTDVKILTSWNGLMIAGLADTGRMLGQPELIAAAEQAAEFLWREARTADGRLRRSYAAGEAKLNAYLDDYAFFAAGLLALHRATGEPKWLARARDVADQQHRRFWDETGRGYFFTSEDHPTLIVRVKNPIDAALPSGNSVSLENLRRLAILTEDDLYLNSAQGTLAALRPIFENVPAGMPRAAVSLAEMGGFEANGR